MQIIWLFGANYCLINSKLAICNHQVPSSNLGAGTIKINGLADNFLNSVWPWVTNGLQNITVLRWIKVLFRHLELTSCLKLWPCSTLPVQPMHITQSFLFQHHGWRDLWCGTTIRWRSWALRGLLHPNHTTQGRRTPDRGPRISGHAPRTSFL